MGNAVLIGVLLGIIVFSKTFQVTDWHDWASLAVGVWAVLAPWLLGFSDEPNAAGLHILTGLVAAMSAGLQLWVRHYEELA